MSFVRKAGDGKYYVCSKLGGPVSNKKTNATGIRFKHRVVNKHSSNKGLVMLNNVCFPSEWVGKRVVFEVRFVEDEDIQE